MTERIAIDIPVGIRDYTLKVAKSALREKPYPRCVFMTDFQRER